MSAGGDEVVGQVVADVERFAGLDAELAEAVGHFFEEAFGRLAGAGGMGEDAAEGGMQKSRTHCGSCSAGTAGAERREGLAVGEQALPNVVRLELGHRVGGPLPAVMPCRLRWKK